MTNFTKNPNQGQPAPQGGQDYKSRLDAILAKAGNNNPIAKLQARPVAQSQTPGQAPQPAIPPAGTPAQPTAKPETPDEKLKRILAMAGQTPAQRAQSQANQKAQAGAANAQNVIQAYMAAVAQDPRKILSLEVDFQNAPNSAADDLYFKAYADAQGNIYWDVFGLDTSMTIPPAIDTYQLIDDYYRGVPDATIRAELAASTITSSQVI